MREGEHELPTANTEHDTLDLRHVIRERKAWHRAQQESRTERNARMVGGGSVDL